MLFSTSGVVVRLHFVQPSTRTVSEDLFPVELQSRDQYGNIGSVSETFSVIISQGTESSATIQAQGKTSFASHGTIMIANTVAENVTLSITLTDNSAGSKVDVTDKVSITFEAGTELIKGFSFSSCICILHNVDN